MSFARNDTPWESLSCLFNPNIHAVCIDPVKLSCSTANIDHGDPYWYISYACAKCIARNLDYAGVYICPKCKLGHRVDPKNKASLSTPQIECVYSTNRSKHVYDSNSNMFSTTVLEGAFSKLLHRGLVIIENFRGRPFFYKKDISRFKTFFKHAILAFLT